MNANLLSKDGSSYGTRCGVCDPFSLTGAMVGAADHPSRPTMSMLGDHQMLGGLQQLVRRPAEETSHKAHHTDGEPGISTPVAADETNAGESDAAAYGGGRKETWRH